MKKIISLSFLFVSFFLCCEENPKALKKKSKSNDTLITIIFKARTFKSDTLRLKTGQYAFKEDNLFYSLDGSFIINQLPKKNYKKSDTIKIYTNKEIILSHGYNVNQYSLYYFKPGDTVVFDYPNELPVCKIININLTDNDLNFLTKLNIQTLNKIKSDFQFFVENERFRTSTEKNENFKTLESLSELKKIKIDSLDVSKLIDVEIYALLKTDLNYLTQKNNKTTLNDSINLSIPSGRELILKSFNSIYKPVLIKSKNSTFVDSRIQLENVIKEKNISTNSKDFLLYKYMVDIISDFSTNDINKCFQFFSATIHDKKLIKVINDKYLLLSKNNNFDINKTPVMNVIKDKFDLTNLIKAKYQNKVVYIDFWASWCAPCRKEMPFSKNLQKEYRNKDVVFLYISIDNDFEKWKIASEKEDLLNNNLLTLNYPNAMFYKELQLKTIPRYLIYDKTGKLVHRNAPSPDSKEIRNELDKFLSQ